MSSKHEIRKLYDTWHENNRSAIAFGEWRLTDKELLINPHKDTLRGLNLIAYLSPDINKNIDSQLLPKLSLVTERYGWVVPREGRHITILDIIPHNSGLDLTEQKARKDDYIAVIQQVIDGFGDSIEVELEGIFASSDGVTIQGYPTNEALHLLREELREALTVAGLANLEHKKYTAETAHSALIKFYSPLNGKALLEEVDKLRDIHLGSFRLSELVLNFSSRYDKHETIEVVETFKLK